MQQNRFVFFCKPIRLQADDKIIPDFNKNKSPDEKPNVQLQPIDHKNTSHVFQDEIIASLGVSLGAGIGILANNLVIGLCCAVILYLLARVFSYKRTKNRDQQEK